MYQKRKTTFLFWIPILLLLLPSALVAQRNTPFQNREFNLYFSNFLIHDSTQTNLFEPTILNYKALESIDSIIYPRKQKRNYFIRKIRRESFICVNTKDFYLTLDPIFNFTGGIDIRDSLNEKLITNSRGVLVRGNIGKQVSFESSFIENQSTFPDYLDAFVDTFKVVPGQGRWKKFKTNGYDYAASQGTFTYQPFSVISIQAGHGKPFIGSGYRSLLLADNAFNYPFAQFKLQHKKISYTVIYASLQVVDKVRKYTSSVNEPLFKKKSASFQYLNFSPTKKISIRLFQATLFQVRDSVHPYFNWNTLNPVIYSSAFQYGLNRSPNVLLGADFKTILTKDLSLYGQYVLDDFSSTKNSLRNKSGFQLGATYFNVLGLKNLIFQFEYNQVRPYTYAHSIPANSYTHYGQSLAHPLGANFKELVGFINYRWKDFFVEFKLNYAIYGADSARKSYGKEIFNSDNFSANGLRSQNNTFLQGEKTKLMYKEVRLNYLLNPATRMIVFIQVIERIQSAPLTEQNNAFIYFGIKTSLFNNYSDF